MNYKYSLGYLAAIFLFISGIFNLDNLLYGVAAILVMIWAELTILTGDKE